MSVPLIRRYIAAGDEVSTSTIVFVGNGFSRQMFDERDLFPADMMKDFVAIHDIAEYNYGDREYRFLVMPDRILLAHSSEEKFSNSLVDAANSVVKTLMNWRNQERTITGLGLNFEAIVLRSSVGNDGAEFCSSLYNAEKLEKTIGSSFAAALCQIIVLENGMQFNTRIEPDGKTNGVNLFFSVNGHQNISPDDILLSKLSNVERARVYIQSLHDSLSREFRGEDL